jgi:amylosucrase
MQVINTGSDHVLGYVRQHDSKRLLVLANFTEQKQTVASNELRLRGLSYSFVDLVTGEQVASGEDLTLEPYRFVWLQAV